MKAIFNLIKVNPKECYVSTMSSRHTQKQLIEEITKYGVVDIFVESRTKTSLDISMSAGELSDFIIAFDDERFKFYTCEIWNAWHGSVLRHYFKVTKKQGIEELKQYILGVIVNRLKIDIPQITINVRFYKTEKMSIDIAKDMEYGKWITFIN